MWIAVTTQYEKYRAFANHDDKHYKAILVDAPEESKKFVGRAPTRLTKRKFKRAGDAVAWAMDFNRRYPKLLLAKKIYDLKEAERKEAIRLANRTLLEKVWDTWHSWLKTLGSMFRNTSIR